MVAEFFEKIWNFFASIPNMLMELFVWAWNEIIIIALEFAEWAISEAIALLLTFMNSLGLTETMNSAFSQMHPSAIYIMHSSGVFEGIQILLGATVVRFIIKLIPFV